MALNKFCKHVLILFQIVTQYLIPAHSIDIFTTTYPYKSYNVSVKRLATPSSKFKFQCDTPAEWFKEYSFIHPGILWPNGRVIYNIEPSLSNDHIQNIGKAITEYEEKTCIRFERRVDKTKENVLNFELDDAVCSQANFCYKGDYQFIKVGTKCGNFASVFVHALGHALCLPHENERSDRDNYVDLSKCPNDHIPPKYDFDTKGYPYDFSSVMHNQCSRCEGGLPKLQGVTHCGIHWKNSLGVLDADKINDLYNCQGCFRHRWRSTDNMTEIDKLAMIAFGYRFQDDQPLFLCRAFIKGEISPGTYRLDKNICYVTYRNRIYKATAHVQVFTLPPPKSNVEAVMKHGTYMTEPLSQGKPLEHDPVPVGRSPTGQVIYAVMATFGKPGREEKSIGKVYGDYKRRSFFTYDETHFEFSIDVDILVCKLGA